MLLKFIAILLAIMISSASPILAKDSMEKTAVRNHLIMKIGDLEAPSFAGLSKKGIKEFSRSFFKKKEQEKIINGLLDNSGIACRFSKMTRSKYIMHIVEKDGTEIKFLCTLDDEKKLSITKLGN